MLAPRPAGRQILDFLTGQKFRILELSLKDAGFRQNTVAILQAVSDAGDALQRGGSVALTEATASAIETNLNKLVA